MTNTGLEAFRYNPFSYREAGNDPNLNRYFVAPIYFDEVLGDPANPQTAIIFAPRGGGKTALRKMVEYHCKEGLTPDRILSVPYTNFTRVTEAVEGNLDRITSRLHIFEILCRAVDALVQELEVSLDALENLSTSQKAHLKWYLLAFGHYLSPSHESFTQIALNLQGAARREGIGFVRGSEDRLSEEVWCALLEREKLPPETLLEEFSQLAEMLGYRAIYVLLDRLDESPLTAADTAAMRAIIEPLLADLTLMDQPRVAFKCFFPDILEQKVLRLPTIRPDRLIIRRVEWIDEDLLKILHERLKASSPHENLDELCVVELRGRIETEMVSLAQGSPRNLVRLGELLFSEHTRIVSKRKKDDHLLITEEAWKEAKRRFSEEVGYLTEASVKAATHTQPLPTSEKHNHTNEPLHFLQDICADFPAPIAMLCRDFLIQPLPDRKFRRLLDLFEVTMHYSLFLLIGGFQVRTSQRDRPKNFLRDRLGLEMKAMTLGRTLMSLPRLAGALSARQDRLGRLFQRFSNANSENLESLGKLRNRFAHGTLEDPAFYETAWRERVGQLAKVFQGLDFLREFQLIWIEGIKRQGTQFIHKVRVCMGDHPNFPWKDFSAESAFECNWLWSVAENYAIPMHPLLVLSRCEQCGQKELFLYNRWDGQKAVYLCPISGHRLITDRYANGLDMLLGLNRG